MMSAYSARGSGSHDANSSSERFSAPLPYLTSFPASPRSIALCSRAALTATGEREGSYCLSSTAAPATCGVAIEVPDQQAYPPGIEEQMSLPGAATSGLM